MKVIDLFEAEAEDLGTLEIVPEGDDWLIVKATNSKGPMKKAIYFVWKAVEGKSGVKVKMASRGKYGSPKMVENPDGLDIIDKAPTRLFFSGISKEQLQVAVDKAIAKQKAAIDKDQKYKAAAPARKAEAAKYQAEKRKK